MYKAESWELKTRGNMKKFKAKSFIIDGKAKSRKRKFYYTAFQLCSRMRDSCRDSANGAPASEKSVNNWEGKQNRLRPSDYKKEKKTSLSGVLSFCV